MRWFLGLLLMFALLGWHGIGVSSAPEMIRIPAGEFTMGSERAGPDEKPSHRVFLNTYLIGKYEVTNEEYYAFWKATGEHTPESFPDEFGGSWPDRALQHPRWPVVGVSWDDAVAYAAWMGMRLPTEAEWEKAARGPTERLWPWGSSLKPYANMQGDEDGYADSPAPVGSFPQGKSYYGLLDMAGNVWEWTADVYSDVYYFLSPRKNPLNEGPGSWRVLRGGSWLDAPSRCTTTFRFYFYPTLRTSFIGFRLAQDAHDASESNSQSQKP